MSTGTELGLIPVFKWLIGALGAGLVVAWGWIANNHSSRLKDVEQEQESMKLSLAKDYLNEQEVDRRIGLMLKPIEQKLDSLIQVMGESVSELRKLNDRVIRVESQKR